MRASAALCLAFTAALAGPALAQTYPAKTVRVVIGWPAGGSNDLAGRVVFQKLAEKYGQQFVIDNRPGAAGVLGAEIVARSPADGYTLMVHSTTHVGNPWTYKKLPYDTFKDFVGVATLVGQPGVLVVHPSLPVKNTKELIALAKSRPGQINFSSSGNGSAPHLSMALFMSLSGTNLLHIPYKGGAPAVTAIVSGETQAMIATLSTIITQINANRVRPLAVSSAQRLKLVPELPTIAESGVPGYEMNPWVGVFAPAGTPRAIVDQLNAEINRTLQMPDVIQTLATQGSEPWIMTADQFQQRLRADYTKYGELIKLAGVSPE
jgi:tripartite-type tricarboxylate transporter receptor subunit TctC